MEQQQQQSQQQPQHFQQQSQQHHHQQQQQPPPMPMPSLKFGPASAQAYEEFDLGFDLDELFTDEFFPGPSFCPPSSPPPAAPLTLLTARPPPCLQATSTS